MRLSIIIWSAIENKSDLLPLVDSAVDRERRNVTRYMNKAARSGYPGVSGQFEIAKAARFTYSGIVQDLNDRKTDLVHATREADDAAAVKKATIRSAALAISCS